MTTPSDFPPDPAGRQPGSAAPDPQAPASEDVGEAWVVPPGVAADDQQGQPSESGAPAEGPIASGGRRRRVERMLSGRRAKIGAVVAAALLVGAGAGAGIAATVVSDGRSGGVADTGTVGHRDWDTDSGDHGPRDGFGPSDQLPGRGRFPGVPGGLPGEDSIQGTSATAHASAAPR